MRTADTNEDKGSKTTTRKTWAKGCQNKTGYKKLGTDEDLTKKTKWHWAAYF